MGPEAASWTAAQQQRGRRAEPRAPCSDYCCTSTTRMGTAHSSVQAAADCLGMRNVDQGLMKPIETRQRIEERSIRIKVDGQTENFLKMTHTQLYMARVTSCNCLKFFTTIAIITLLFQHNCKFNRSSRWISIMRARATMKMAHSCRCMKSCRSDMISCLFDMKFMHICGPSYPRRPDGVFSCL